MLPLPNDSTPPADAGRPAAPPAPRRLQAALRQGERLAQAVLDALLVFAGVCTPEGILVSANRTALEAAGLQPDEVLGRPFDETYWWAYDPAVQARLREALAAAAAGRASRYDTVVRLGEGRLIDIDFQLMPVFTEAGEVAHLVSSAVEITHRKRVEQALHESWRFLRSTLDALSAHIAVLDEAGTIVAVNRAWERFAAHNGAAPSAVGVGVNYLAACEAASEAEAKAVAEGLRAVLRGDQEAFTCEYPCHGPGEERWFVLRVSRFAGSGPLRLVTVHEDVTDRKQAELALRESERRFRSLFEHSPDAVFVVDLAGQVAGKVLDVNPAACRLHRVPREALLARDVRELVPPEQRDQAAGDFERLARGEVGLLQVYRWTVNQHAVPVEIRAQRFVYDGREALLLLVRDISERRRLEHEVLRISEEERQRIGQDIHDGLASHFSGIALLSRGLLNQWTKARHISPEMLEEIAGLARKGNEQARALARGLSPVRLEAEGLQTALQELAHDAERLGGPACALDVDDELPALPPGVASQLYRIAQEALSNAARHAGARRLGLSLRREDDHLVLTVRDDGAGLPPEAAAAGGMGLHIMPYRARMIGALLTIDSAPGEGTAVRCRVPLPTDPTPSLP